MPKSNAPAAKTVKFLICDTNIVILMMLFKPSVMFEYSYPFGSVEVHESVINEIERWVENKNIKFRKFGENILNDALKYSRARTGNLKEMTKPEREKALNVLKVMENKLDASQMSAPTSPTDRYLLALAYKNKANLATQEKTLSSLALKSLGTDRVISFGLMIQTLFEKSILTKEEIQTGMHSLDYYKEHLRKEDREILRKILDA